MLQHTDPATGLRLTLGPDPAPRNPRLAEEPLFHFLTWRRGIGDPHDWPTPWAFLRAMRDVPALILPVQAAWSGGRPCFGTILREGDRAIGYAFATHERLRLHFAVEALSPEHLENAALVCETEFLAYEEFLGGDVHAFTIVAPNGPVLERRDALMGEEWAEALAWEAFARHLDRWRNREPRRRTA